MKRFIVPAVALAAGGGCGGAETQTLQLKGGKETRVQFRAPAMIKGHPLKGMAWSSNEPISGDRTGEYVRTCMPLPVDDIECHGAFLLGDGVVEVGLTEKANPSVPASDGAIVGGTRAYAGAVGSYQVDWKKNTYTLKCELLK